MMVTITNRQLRNQFQDLFEKNEMAPVFGALGRGTADSTVLDYFGLEASEKAVYFSIVTESMWKQLRRELIIKMQIDVPGTGIAFIVPVSSIGGKKVLQYLIGGQEFEKEEQLQIREVLIMLWMQHGVRMQVEERLFMQKEPEWKKQKNF